MEPESFFTLERRLRHEPPRIKHSRFVATAAPCSSPESAAAVVESVAAEFPDARHHCWGWRLAPDGRRYRFNDDGEPSGSAGRPILQQIEGHDVVDAIVVVTRWFGGIKLGVGGLVRAYGGAASEALDRATRREVFRTEPLHVRVSYDASGAVQAVLGRLDPAPTRVEYGEVVDLHFDVAPSRRQALVRTLTDATRGQLELIPAPDEPR